MSEQELLSFASGGNAAEVRRLLEDEDSHVNVNAKDRDGLTSLLLATKGGHREVVRLLLRNDAD